ncbi:MAG: ketosteroid isomerase-like protein [Psychromonas sp.]|jgi:ketosteroid isomerase-like protein
MKRNDIVEELYRCIRQQDVECFKQLCSPSIIWQQNSGFPRGGTSQSPAAVLSKIYKALNHDWINWSFVIDRILDAGDDIVVLGYFNGSHRENNQRFELAASHIYSFNEGKVIKFQQFIDESVEVFRGSDLKIAQ